MKPGDRVKVELAGHVMHGRTGEGVSSVTDDFLGKLYEVRVKDFEHTTAFTGGCLRRLIGRKR
jgi:hypothetical protein